MDELLLAGLFVAVPYWATVNDGRMVNVLSGPRYIA